MKKLYKFIASYGRMGTLKGLFVSTDEDIHSLTGKTIYFGEVLGKHSKVMFEDFEPWRYITCLSDNQANIDWLISLVGGNTISGYNPLNYVYFGE